jgi:hypothetical protein
MRRMRTRLMLLAVVVVWARLGGGPAASPGAPVAHPAVTLDSYCGDGVCDTGPCGEWQTPHDGCDEDKGGVFGFCWEDCGYCGDGQCEQGLGEDNTTCSEDCYCGDGACEPDEMSGSGTTCSDDCVPPPPFSPPGSCNECSPSVQDCGGGYYCNSDACCVPPCEGDSCGGFSRGCELESIQCITNSDCCSDEYCYRDDGFPGICIPDYIPS